jgi:hypothetical protein
VFSPIKIEAVSKVWTGIGGALAFSTRFVYGSGF